MMKLNLLNDNIELGALRLRVVDLENMIKYYTEVMGLSVMDQDNGVVKLGIDEKVYLELEYKEGNVLADANYAGLYHMAFVLPDEDDLVAFVLHLVETKNNPSGAADHLFSQAIYFNDPEGNGIEVYVDRPKEEWGFEEGKQLPLVSDPLDFEALKDKFDGRVWNKMPKGARLGHIHYTVWKMPKAKDFVLNTLGMDTMIEIPTALFISKNGYHHHFGMNIWSRVKDEVLPDHMSGLVSSTILVDNLDEIKEKLKDYDGEYHIEDERVVIKDGQGLTFILRR